MINKSLVTTALMTLLCVGCSKEYSHRRFAADGPEAEQAKALAARLRQAQADELDKIMTSQTMSGLTRPQLENLRFGLGRIISADSVELQKIEQFGKEVYRAVFTLRIEDRSESVSMLLAIGAGDKLKWIGKN
ncbi:MAG: hypothetical protein QGG42_02380 [Phycisphaerae bacterium]|jgi:hypothetical protein|nr:hypothetical protein [Phycisphaerae bacterium]